MEVGDGRVWVLIVGNTPIPHALPGAMARRLGASLECHRLEVRDEAHPESEEGYAYSHEAFSVGARGERAPSPSGLDELSPEEANFGDLYETVDGMLRLAITEEDFARAGDSFALAQKPSTLAPRLADLARQIRDAGSWSVSARGDQLRARLSLPDGSRRISILTADEVDALERETGIAAG